MVEKKLTKAEQFAEMHSILQRIDKDFYGNGNPGIKTRFERWEGSLRTFKYIFAVLGIGNVVAIIKLFM